MFDISNLFSRILVAGPTSTIKKGTIQERYKSFGGCISPSKQCTFGPCKMAFEGIHHTACPTSSTISVISPCHKLDPFPCEFALKPNFSRTFWSAASMFIKHGSTVPRVLVSWVLFSSRRALSYNIHSALPLS